MGWAQALVLWICVSFPSISPSMTLSLQTELSLQKEQLQLKIIEIEDEAEKWQKEKDRIKVSSPQTPRAALALPVLPGRRQALVPTGGFSTQ